MTDVTRGAPPAQVRSQVYGAQVQKGMKVHNRNGTVDWSNVESNHILWQVCLYYYTVS